MASYDIQFCLPLCRLWILLVILHDQLKNKHLYGLHTHRNQISDYHRLGLPFYLAFHLQKMLLSVDMGVLFHVSLLRMDIFIPLFALNMTCKPENKRGLLCQLPFTFAEVTIFKWKLAIDVIPTSLSYNHNLTTRSLVVLCFSSSNGKNSMLTSVKQIFLFNKKRIIMI